MKHILFTLLLMVSITPQADAKMSRTARKELKTVFLQACNTNESLTSFKKMGLCQAWTKCILDKMDAVFEDDSSLKGMAGIHHKEYEGFMFTLGYTCGIKVIKANKFGRII